MTMPRFRTALSLTFLVALTVGCDNVGRAFGPNTQPDPGGGTAGESTIEVVPVGGDLRDGRPKVKAAFPNGSGWPTLVPIVIEFSESLNQASILPTAPTATDGRIVLRVRGSTQALPCQYDFLANGRVLVMRPVTALSNAQVATYEVVLLPDGRDADGVRFLVNGSEQILTDFQVNQATSFTDGRILTTFPRDNSSDITRETDYLVFFDRPANEASINATNMRLRRRGGGDVAVSRTLPLTTVGVNDSRVVRLRPQDRLLAATTHEFVCDDTVTFGTDGKLDFRGRTPFAVFDTVGVAAPSLVELGNPVTGFPNKVNLTNFANPVLHVTSAVDAAAGDRIVARIYGGKADTSNTADMTFVERTAVLPAAGEQTVAIEFPGLLGTMARPKFDDGELTFAVQAQRGGEHSGFVHNSGSDDAAFDITLPTLSRAGPPSVGTSFDVVTDQESLAFYGTASEAVGKVTLTDGMVSAELFASSDDGRFLVRPVALGRLTAPRMYSLTLQDRAGNFAPGAVSGQIVQRGVLTGTVADELTVEVYDHRTLQPIPGAKVLVEPAPPTVPSTGRQVGTTGSNGRFTFTGLTAPSHTITVVQPGFHLLTIYDTAAAFASLPLRPLSNVTATLRGNVLFTQAPGTTVLVGSTAFDDANEFAVRTADASPTTIPATSITPNRPAIVTAFGGVLEPTMRPAFNLQGFQSLGNDGMSLAPPLLPPAAGAASEQSLVLLPSTGQIGLLFQPVPLDFSLATGLDTANLVGGGPLVRVTASLRGFAAQALMGVGFAVLTTGSTFNIDGNWTLPGFIAFTPFDANALAWIVADARDGAGRISRTRIRFNTLTGLDENRVPPQAIPAVTVPTGPSVGSPAVEFADVLDPAAVLSTLCTVDVVAEDAAGRRWTLLVADSDAAGLTKTVQFPDLTGAGVTGLQTGTWNVRPEARTWVSVGATADEFVLADRRRLEVAYSRGLAVPFTIQ